MSSFFKNVTGQKPMVYGLSYLGLIPIFAILFGLLPAEYFNLNDHEANGFSYFYFSVVTITTLGYGDILPIGPVSQTLTALESVLGITLIGLFLNSLSHQHGLEVQESEKTIQKTNENTQAKNRFSAFNKLVELKIKRYESYVFPIIVPMKNRGSDFNTINESFAFNDMRDLFKSTTRMTDHHFTPAINYYFISLKELIETIEELIKLGYVQKWPELESLCVQFISVSKGLDFSDHILNQPKVRLGNESGSDSDSKMIESHEGEVKFLESNAINPYVALYLLIHGGFNFVKEYRRLAIEIEKG